MGQVEVQEWLEEQRENNDKWYSIKDIKEALMEKGMSESCINKVYDNLYKLSLYDVIEAKGVGLWDHKKVFRGKK